MKSETYMSVLNTEIMLAENNTGACLQTVCDEE